MINGSLRAPFFFVSIMDKEDIIMQTKQVVIVVTIDVEDYPDQETIEYLEEDVINFVADHKEFSKYVGNDPSGEMAIAIKLK